jgi:hypothetical protein
VEFGALQEQLETEGYPLSNEQLLENHGHRELSHANGSETLQSILEPVHDEYESMEEVRQAILTMISEEAEGRQEYTDRGTNARNENLDQQSF